MSTSCVQGCARELLEYFHQHPEGSDTIEGIAQWWAAADRVRPSHRTLKAALRRLVDLNYVEECSKRRGATFYRLNVQAMSSSKK